MRFVSVGASLPYQIPGHSEIQDAFTNRSRREQTGMTDPREYAVLGRRFVLRISRFE